MSKDETKATEPSLDSRIAEILKDARIVSIKPEVSYDGELWQWNQKAKAAIKTLVEGEVRKEREDWLKITSALLNQVKELSNPNEERS